jgi:sigma-B regulation protein RsbU (phosphoserine phosphatase)
MDPMATSYRIHPSPAAGSKRCGDFAKVVELPPHRRAFIVGDVAGHGAGAGDGAAALSAYVRYLISLQAGLAETLRAASDFFTRRVMNETMSFASLFIAVADLRDGTLAYASAGHEPGMLFDRADASAHVHLQPTGPVLGLHGSSVFHQQTIPLFAESLLVVVTDGITDARRHVDDELSFFGTAGVTRAVYSAVRQRRDPVHEIYSAAVMHSGGALTDDACVLVSPLMSAAAAALR